MQAQEPQQQIQVPPEVQKKYMQIKGDYTTIFKTVIKLEDEKRETILVLEAIKDLEHTRRCWRQIGGVLVERTIGEVIPALKQRVDGEITEKLKVYNERLAVKQKELHAIEKSLGINNKGEDKDEDIKENDRVGVLA